MTKIFRTGIRRLRSDNLKSKIENLRLVGLLAIVLTFVFGGAVATAQQAGKIFRIGFLDNSNASGIAVLSEASTRANQAWMD